MSGIAAGCVIHWANYQFSDGAIADKYLVILGAKTGSNYLAVVGTSQPRRRSLTPGCHPQEGYYFIPGGGKDWFRKDTWLLLAEPREIAPAELLKLALVEKTVTVEGQLRVELANAIRNCLKRCHDVSELHLRLL